MDAKMRARIVRGTALIVLVAAYTHAFAIGLGSLQVHSGLNQALRATVPVSGVESTSLGELCPKGKIETFDGVLIARPVIGFINASSLSITTARPINEPAVAINIEIGCGTSISRNYQILLDPVAIPPAIAKAQVANTTTDPSNIPTGSLPPDVVVQVAATSVTPTAATAAVSSNKTAAAQEPNARQKKKSSTAAPTRQRPQQPSRKVTRNVLRLSSDISSMDSSNMLNGMKLSHSLTMPGAETDPQKELEMRAAQSRFAAVMRGEDPEKNAEAETKAAHEKIDALKIEAERIGKQAEADRLAFEAEQEKSLHIGWFIGLASLLVLSLVMIGWLYWRLAQSERLNQRPFWERDESDDGELEMDEQETSPFSDTVADFGNELPSRGDEIRVVPPQESSAEHDATFGKPAGHRIQRVSKSQVAKVPAPAEPSSEKPAGATADILPMQKPTLIPRYQKRSEMIKVEEISDAMEEAEFWMSLRDPQRAIHVLEQYGQVEPPHSPMPWLYLLQLYRQVNEREQYEALLRRFRFVFNSKAPAWDEKEQDASILGLEDYPHLVNQICGLWGTNELVPYLENLIFNDREAGRQGFELPVYLDLIMLANIAYEVMPSNRFKKPVNA